MKMRLFVFFLLFPFWVCAMNWQQEYRNERDNLSQEEVLTILDQGNKLLDKTDLVHSLIVGGSAFFPHTYLKDCGDQIAAVAQASVLAAEETGKNQILVLGVLHPLTDELRRVRTKEKQGFDVSDEPLRGILGPDLVHAEFLSEEFSVESFLFLLEHIVRIRGTPMPRVIVRYPHLVQGNADSLPGMEELRKLAVDSIVVATSDLCHHGSVYRTPVEFRLPIGKKAFAFTTEMIKKGLDRLSMVDLSGYRIATYEAKSDSMCVGQIMSVLLGPLEAKIQDLKLVDLDKVFPEYPSPNWVAATLVELKPIAH